MTPTTPERQTRMTATTSVPVALDVDADGVARLRLNRPEASNGLNVELLQALHAAVLQCHANPAVRVVLLTGEGRNFCAGGDIHTFESKGEHLPAYLREATAWLQLATSALIQLRVPVVTAVQGFAAGGGGLGLVCASDVVVAAESAKFFSGAVRVGMAPDGGSSVTLTQLIGLRQALRLLLLNPTVTASEACDLGLVTEVVADDALAARAEEIATTMAGLPTLALSATKRLVWNGVGASVEQRLSEESRTVSELSGTADAMEGLRAVIERREPRFTGR
jgi:2-(1,2-epoxy-1,2-dihydrophenyl)acetyl-CoA isomerase